MSSPSNEFDTGGGAVGGSTSKDDSLKDSIGEYVDGSDVKWIKIAQSWVGGLFNAYVLGMIAFIGAVSEGARTAFLGVLTWFGDLVGGLFGIVSVSPWEFVDATMVVLQDLGPLAWPLAIAIVGFALLVGLEVVSGG